ncbi:hypothetical protein C0992_003790 [Termitomyces sp. T32_za158]|nr:hypothetical protein C0992_003790 [Termitomyces sp. T32_za158]
MSSLQKYFSVKKGLKKLFSRSPSPAPPGDSADDTGPQRMEAISPTASNTPLASADDNLSRGTGDVPSNQAPAGVSSVGQKHSGMKIAWHGIQMLLQKFGKVLDGTPLKNPVNAVNILIDLGNAIVDNKDALQELFSHTKSRLEVVNSALMKIEEEDTTFRLKSEAFAQFLIDKILELRSMSERSTWKVILESDEDKTIIGNILKKIDQETDIFVLFINLEIERNTRALKNAAYLQTLKDWHTSENASYDVHFNDTKLARVSCTQGTRRSILDQLYEWAQNSSSQSPQ